MSLENMLKGNYPLVCNCFLIFVPPSLTVLRVKTMNSHVTSNRIYSKEIYNASH